MVVVSKSGPVIRKDNTVVMVGPESAVPVFVDDKIYFLLKK